MKNNSSKTSQLDAMLDHALSNTKRLDYATPGGIRPGTVYAYSATAPEGQAFAMANESRLAEDHYRQPLVDYIAGHSDDQGTRAQLERLFPSVEVSRLFTYKSVPNAEAFLSESDDIRAVGSDFKKILETRDNVPAQTHNKGLMIRLDKDSGITPNLERVALRLANRLELNDLRRGISALLAIDNTGTNKTWNSSAVPDGDMASLIASAGDDSGFDANTLVIGQGAWLLRYSALLAQSTSGGFAANMTPDQLGAILGVDQLVRVKQRYATSKAATSKTRVLANYVIATYIEPMPMKDDPSAIKRFVSPTDQGGELAVHVVEETKWVDVIVEHYSNIIATVSEGTKRLNIS